MNKYNSSEVVEEICWIFSNRICRIPIYTLHVVVTVLFIGHFCYCYSKRW